MKKKDDWIIVNIVRKEPKEINIHIRDIENGKVVIKSKKINNENRDKQ